MTERGDNDPPGTPNEGAPSDFRTEVTPDGEVIVYKHVSIRYGNMDAYKGDMRNGKRWGRGEFIRRNGDRYLGSFRDNLYHGKGTMTLAEHRVGGKLVVGWKYTGEWNHGRRDGYGVLQDGQGNVYEGYFKNDIFHGHGVYHRSNGDVYEGEWVKGRKQGRGRLVRADESAYEGEFYRGEPHGQGTLYYRRKQGSYTGSFKNGMRHGVGKRVWSNGAEFEGEWLDDVMSGRGVYRHPRGDLYVGDFQDNRFHGYGTLQQSTGDRYTGQFERGVPCGVGRYDYPSGGFYEGEYWALARTGVKWRRDARDMEEEEDEEGTRGVHWQHGLGKVTDPSQKLKWKEEARRRLERAYDWENPLSKRDRLKIHFMNRKYGRILVGGPYDDPSKDGVMHPIADGKRHGKGLRVWSSGARYEGDWFQDEMHGFGIYIGAGDTADRYEGEWVFGCREGRGVCSYGNTSGAAYVCPLGRLQSGEARCVYDGDWLAGRFHGDGKFNWGDGRWYEGGFQDGKRHGYGKELLVSDKELRAERRQRGGSALVFRGLRYEGMYEDNVRNGRGTLWMATGDQLDGVMRRGHFDGPVRISFARGGVAFAVYKEGERKEWLKGEALERLRAEETSFALMQGRRISHRAVEHHAHQQQQARRAAADEAAEEEQQEPREGAVVAVRGRWGGRARPRRN